MTQNHLDKLWFIFCKEIILKFKFFFLKVSKGAKIRNRHNQVPHPTQDTNGKATNPQQTPQTRAKRPGPPPPSRRPQSTHKQTRTKTQQTQDRTKTQKIHKRSTALERSVKHLTGGLKPVQRFGLQNS